MDLIACRQRHLRLVIFPIPYLHINSNFRSDRVCYRSGCGRNGMKMKGERNFNDACGLVFEEVKRFIKINRNLKSKYSW